MGSAEPKADDYRRNVSLAPPRKGAAASPDSGFPARRVSNMRSAFARLASRASLAAAMT